jgi:hypothetical protein
MAIASRVGRSHINVEALTCFDNRQLLCQGANRFFPQMEGGLGIMVEIKDKKTSTDLTANDTQVGLVLTTEPGMDQSLVGRRFLEWLPGAKWLLVFPHRNNR